MTDRFEREDLEAAARVLLGELLERPLGTLSPSVYETARLVTVAPWLTGHATRLRFLVDAQRPDGSWEDPGPAADGYALVPTLSATEALLTALSGACAGQPRLVAAADLGLAKLSEWLDEPSRLPVPDTCAIEVIVPALVEAIGGHLARMRETPVPGLERWAGREPLRVPEGLDDTGYRALRPLLLSGMEVPHKVRYILEVDPQAARRARGIRPVVPPGTVGASPAATAAWIGADAMPAQDTPAVRYLEHTIDQFHGLAPTVLPVDVFERVMVLSTLARAGLRTHVPRELVESLRSTLGETGTPGGAGLPTDSDSTSLTLLTLNTLGVPQDVDRLFAYEQPTHFNTWDDGKPEATSSVSVNGHVLEALGDYVERHPEAGARHHAAIRTASTWLCAQQHADGYWRDKWHASRYYATACAAIPLHAHCRTRQECVLAVERAVRWVVATQRDDGSWGRWEGNVEETGYAMNLLLLTDSGRSPAGQAAVARGSAYLEEVFDDHAVPALWYGKDLYALPAVSKAFTVAALHLARAASVPPGG